MSIHYLTTVIFKDIFMTLSYFYGKKISLEMKDILGKSRDILSTTRDPQCVLNYFNEITYFFNNNIVHEIIVLMPF